VQRQNEVLKEDVARLKAFIATPPPERSTFPLHVSEVEEDVAFARDTGLLSKQAAEQILRELEFENAEISFDE
jgi:hypothetical protein